MAIIVEEEKKGSIMGVVRWLFVLVVIGLTVYYIFVAKPQLVEIAVPQNFKNIDPIAKLNLNPEEVVNSQSFQSLKQYITLPVPGNAGRSNPLLPF